MTDLDELDAALASEPIAPPTLAGATGRPKCWRHDFVLTLDRTGEYPPSWICARCHKVRSEAHAKRGKAAVQRSKREERKLAKDYIGQRTGHHGGPDDVQTALLNVQSKAGSSWYSMRYQVELDKLPRTGGRSPALIVSNGKPGHLVRRYVVIGEKDFRALYGDRILDGDKP